MSELRFPRFGHLLTAGGKVFGRCYDCGDIVRVDKPILGSLHLCVTDEEAAQQPWRRRSLHPPA